MHKASCRYKRALLVNQRSECSWDGGHRVLVQHSGSCGGIRLAHRHFSIVLRIDERARTMRFQRRSGVAPISFAIIAHVVGPTYAATAAFKTRVGRNGYVELTYSAANSPSSELPRMERFPFALGKGSPGFCFS